MKISTKRKWLVIVLLLAALGGSAIFVEFISSDRLDVARVESLGGRVLSTSIWPRWLPRPGILGARRMRRIYGVDFSGANLGRTRLLEVLQSMGGAEQMLSLRIGNNGLRDADLQVLRRFPALRDLDLSNSPVHDEGLARLKHCPQIEILNLAGTFVTDAGLPHLCGLTRLWALSLDHTEVTDAGMHELACLPRLRELTVSATDVSEDGLRAIQQHLPELSVSDD